MLNFEIHKLTGSGKNYEDCHGIKSWDENTALIVLADGMGETDCAKDAAEVAVSTILDNFDTSNITNESLRQVIMFTNDKIAEICLNRKCKMGCSISVAYLNHDELLYVSLGNVRITIWQNGIDRIITQDDVYVASNGNVFLSKSLSGKDLVGKVDIKTYNLNTVNRIILATDGAYNHDVNDDATEITIDILPTTE